MSIEWNIILYNILTEWNTITQSLRKAGKYSQIIFAIVAIKINKIKVTSLTFFFGKLNVNLLAYFFFK